MYFSRFSPVEVAAPIDFESQSGERNNQSGDGKTARPALFGFHFAAGFEIGAPGIRQMDAQRNVGIRPCDADMPEGFERAQDGMKILAFAKEFCRVGLQRNRRRIAPLRFGEENRHEAKKRVSGNWFNAHEDTPFVFYEQYNTAVKKQTDSDGKDRRT